MKTIIPFILAIMLLPFSLPSQASEENVFYILHSTQMPELSTYLAIVDKNHQSIHMLISQAFIVDADGKLSGYLNQEVVDLAKKHSIKLMAMITNSDFNQKKAHAFLSSKDAQEKAISAILDISKKNNLYGVQFDFEKISVEDRDALSKFYQLAAIKLHEQGLKMSVATIPAFPEQMKDSIFLQKMWKNWTGAYDLKAIGACSDFVSIMAYNQHPDGTIPGPNASIGFVKAAIENALKEIPAEKISLGIPAYSLYWFSGHHFIPMKQVEIAYKDAINIIKKNHAAIYWSKEDKLNYARYEHNWLDEYVFLEDKDSFKAKQELVKKFKLRGISVFRIGSEDDGIWKKL